MNDLPVIAYRADGSAEIGLGHIVHAIRLGRLLKKDRIADIQLISNLELAVEKIANEAGVQLWMQKLPEESGSFDLIYKIYREINASAVIINFNKKQLDIAVPLFHSLRYAKLPQIHFDNPCPGFELADIVINALPHPDYGLDYSNHPAFYSGLQYLLLADEFINAARDIRKRSGEVKRILISMGGGDNENISALILQGLEIAGYKGVVDLVIGMANPRTLELKKIAKSLSFEINIHGHLPTLAGLAGNSDLAFSSLGVSTYEFASVGLPVVIIAGTPFNASIADIYSRSGAAISLGCCTDWKIENLAEKIKYILSNRKRLAEMSTVAQTSVDGKGSERVKSIIERFLKKKLHYEK